MERGRTVEEILKDKGPLNWGNLQEALEAREDKKLHPEQVKRAIEQAHKWSEVESIEGYYYLPEQKVHAYDLANEPHPVLALEKIVLRKDTRFGTYCIVHVKNKGDIRARDCMAYLTISNDEVISEGQSVWMSKIGLGMGKTEIFPKKKKGLLILRTQEQMPNQLHIPVGPSQDSPEGFVYSVFTFGRELKEDEEYIFTIEVDTLSFPPSRKKIKLSEILRELKRSPAF